MICKEHSAGSKVEYRCEVCDLIKPREHFSKAAIRREEIVSLLILASIRPLTLDEDL